MRTRILLLMLILSFAACNAQDKEKKNDDLKTETDKSAIPKGSWKVDKEFDENGNLISYDSTYVYSYSTVEGDSINNEDVDEIFKNFRRFFHNQQMSGHSGLMNSFLNDSLYGDPNFFEDDFFSNRMMSRHFQEQIRQMDSMRNEFLKQHYPQLYKENQQKLIPREEGTQNGRI
ncbi:MAG: hypothetical protein R3214_15220 [Christiangramia sp.]|nr:hypothetical protein [Christiangramia sp.]